MIGDTLLFWAISTVFFSMSAIPALGASILVAFGVQLFAAIFAD